MRPLVLAGILALLAGCSLPYQGTSFKAIPKPEQMAEGEHGKVNDATSADGSEPRNVAGSEHEAGSLQNSAPLYGADKDDQFPDVASTHWAYERGNGGPSRTNVVFPDKVQPAP